MTLRSEILVSSKIDPSAGPVRRRIAVEVVANEAGRLVLILPDADCVRLLPRSYATQGTADRAVLRFLVSLFGEQCRREAPGSFSFEAPADAPFPEGYGDHASDFEDAYMVDMVDTFPTLDDLMDARRERQEAVAVLPAGLAADHASDPRAARIVDLLEGRDTSFTSHVAWRCRVTRLHASVAQGDPRRHEEVAVFTFGGTSCTDAAWALGEILDIKPEIGAWGSVSLIKVLDGGGVVGCHFSGLYVFGRDAVPPRQMVGLVSEIMAAMERAESAPVPSLPATEAA